MPDLAAAVAEGASCRPAARAAGGRAAPRRRRAGRAGARATSTPSSSRSRPRATPCAPPRPSPPALRADPDAAPERAWLLTAALVGALVDAGATGALHAGALAGHLVLEARRAAPTPSWRALAFEEQAAPIDRLRAQAVALPAGRARPTRPTSARRSAPRTRSRSPPRVAALGGRPADPASRRRARGGGARAARGRRRAGASRPHDDPDPARRVARRILQRLDGMGKWGGYHTEFSHLARGFARNDRALAERGRRGAARRRAAQREAERGSAPRVPQPAARRATIRALIEPATCPTG